MIKRKYTSRRDKNYNDSIDNECVINSVKKYAIELKDQDGKTNYLRSNPRLRSYGANFKSLLKQNCINTTHPVINMLINYESTRVIAVLKQCDHKYVVQMYSLDNY